MRRSVSVLALLLVVVLPGPARATWSILIADRRTRELAIGSVTCLTSFDLRAITPVLLVGIGGAAVQAAGDFDGVRRPIVRAGLEDGLSPAEILAAVAAVPGHSQRQYGIVDTLGRTATFTGSSTFAWAGGVTGQQGDVFYAIQGNILAGSCVVDAAETALLGAAGDIPARLMAAMEAARAAGGDGRCSCNPAAATSCGCPPPSFAKSGHIGYMLDARIGDVDDPVCSASGCADGDYFMNFNVAFQTASSPDPVIQLQALYDDWRAGLWGRPDAVQSVVTFVPLLGGQPGDLEMRVELLDLEGDPLTVPTVTLTVEHAAGSAGASTIGDIVDLGSGIFSIPITGAPAPALDRFRITADDGIRPVVLMPDPEVCVGTGTSDPDCDGNGIADACDIASGAATDDNGDGIPDSCQLFLRGDCNADDQRDIADAIFLLSYLFTEPAANPTCAVACDSNDDGLLDLSDAIHHLSTLILGPPPLPPWPDCGVDATPDDLDCAVPACD